MNGTVERISADSATTTGEICAQLSQRLGLGNSFGFSLFISMADRVSSLGTSDGEHIMDAIAQCELADKDNIAEAHWQLFFRKEIFEPWYKAGDDPISTNLIYQQIVRGVRFGEYRFDKVGEQHMSVDTCLAFRTRIWRC